MSDTEQNTESVEQSALEEKQPVEETEVHQDQQDQEQDQRDQEQDQSDQEQPAEDKEPDLEADVVKLAKHKKQSTEPSEASSTVDKSKNKKLKRPHSDIDNDGNDNKGSIDDSNTRDLEEEDAETRRKREFEEKFEALLKKPTKRRKKDDVDLEAMQDEAIAQLKLMMKDSAYLDIECVNSKKPATHKLKLLPAVKDTLLKSNLYDSILDNNLLEAVRIWLEPLPDGSLPSFEIQRTLFNELVKLPIKTIHLRESGLGKLMIFYQKSKKVDPSLKKIAEKLIGDWTRPIMGRSDNYRAKKIATAAFDFEKFQSDIKLSSSSSSNSKNITKKSLYQESADRRKRAAAPEARTSVYSVAPEVNPNLLNQNKSNVSSMGIGSSLSRDERFRKLNQRLNNLSQKKKNVKKGGVSIEGRGLAM